MCENAQLDSTFKSVGLLYAVDPLCGATMWIYYHAEPTYPLAHEN
jgi:hypothetical protein